MNNHNKKVIVIGLDCATPQLVFDEWIDDLPNMKKLINSGIYGELESIIPPITVPAWTAMVTGKDPGELGCYGFRNRKDYSYDQLSFANSLGVKDNTLWDILSKKGKKSILVGVPQTYPPKPINGCMISCFLTLGTKNQYTYPPELKDEIEAVAGGYMLDVDDFRSENKQRILDDIYKMTEKRFKVARHLLNTKEWDFFMMVEMGIDRIHHGFWKYTDKTHRSYEHGSPFNHAIFDYYQYVDREIGVILSLLEKDTTVLVVSDHGAKKMDGGICINEWLLKEGFLALKNKPDTVTPIEKAEIDWGKTKAWGEGGYYSRLFLNIKGREPHGTIKSEDYEKTRDELKEKLEALGDEEGRPIGSKVYKPQEIYKECNGIPPDLIVLFGDLSWRSIGSIGHGKVHVFENDRGIDYANHSQQGIFIMSDLANTHSKKLTKVHLLDIAPTILNLFGMETQNSLRGKIIQNEAAVYNECEESEIRERLEALGYIE
ncbi:MAG: alkaline phosphatase family protein [Candidatus Loosdrechtia sp.]|uniref:alkaline phosphatase family protein n=1 Tax=Candidatus Loosdrechtia sp. TaxID=3101272 RepID=UPI003A722131|nr:MAG: alkaline phosphatase family protein [Candidatus Jettenia sp. AMX2]